MNKDLTNEPKRFSNDWELAWFSHDLDVILSQYSEDIIFRSNKAIPLVGSGEIKAKKNLRTYWGKALAGQPDLNFEVLDVFEGYDMLVILYSNHMGIRATETLYFDDSDQIKQASACHQVAKN